MRFESANTWMMYHSFLNHQTATVGTLNYMLFLNHCRFKTKILIENFGPRFVIRLKSKVYISQHSRNFARHRLVLHQQNTGCSEVNLPEIKQKLCPHLRRTSLFLFYPSYAEGAVI